MKRLFPIAALLLATALSTGAFAGNPQAATPAQAKPTFAAVYDKLISSVEKEVVDAATAMPEDKFGLLLELRYDPNGQLASAKCINEKLMPDDN